MHTCMKTTAWNQIIFEVNEPEIELQLAKLPLNFPYVVTENSTNSLNKVKPL